MLCFSVSLLGYEYCFHSNQSEPNLLYKSGPHLYVHFWLLAGMGNAEITRKDVTVTGRKNDENHM